MYDILKNPKKQVIVIVILISGYWSYHYTFDNIDLPVKVVVQSSDGVPTDTLTYEDELESYPPSESEGRTPANSESVSEYEYKIRYWDMLLGHLASILGSLAALLSPLVTVYLNKKGYFNTDNNPENVDS